MTDAMRIEAENASSSNQTLKLVPMRALRYPWSDVCAMYEDLVWTNSTRSSTVPSFDRSKRSFRIRGSNGAGETTVVNSRTIPC